MFSGLMNPDIENGNVRSAAFCHDCMYLYREVCCMYLPHIGKSIRVSYTV